MEFIDLRRQYAAMQGVVEARMRAVFEHGRFVLGPEVEELEHALASFVGVGHCVGVASGTDALMVALMALGTGPGDEVITTPFSFIATAEAVALLGARPVFVDICPRTFNIDPARIEAAISPRTRVILPVGLYGQCADMDAINEIAERHGLAVVEDAAQSFGATYKGRRSCALSSVGCTSFFPSKPLGCYGDGGACFTDDEALAERMRMIRVHGQERRYHHAVLGLNARLDTLQAAVLLAKLPHYAAEMDARDAAAARYASAIAGLRAAIDLPVVTEHNRSVHAQYTIALDARDEVARALAARGIPTAVHYPVPLHLQPVFADVRAAVGSLPVSERSAQRVLSLPMHAYIDAEEQAAVVAALASALEEVGGGA